jgi:hypothetical protein
LTTVDGQLGLPLILWHHMLAGQKLCHILTLTALNGHAVLRHQELLQMPARLILQSMHLRH